MSIEKKIEKKIEEAHKVVKRHSLLVRIGCVVAGIALTRLSGSAHWSLSSVLNGISMVLFLYALVCEILVHKEQPSRFIKELVMAGAAFAALMFLVDWLQGRDNIMATINLAVILTYLFYIYKTHIQVHLKRFMKKAE